MKLCYSVLAEKKKIERSVTHSMMPAICGSITHTMSNVWNPSVPPPVDRVLLPVPVLQEAHLEALTREC